MKNIGDKTLQISGVTSVVIQERMVGDNADTIANAFWAKLEKEKQGITMDMKPNLEVWPSMETPLVTKQIQAMLLQKRALIYVLGIFRYTENGREVKTEVCAWLSDGKQYTLCAKHNS